jgi:hypothetical protein
MHRKNNSGFLFKALTVYKKAFSLAMEVFETTKKFPADEKYGLTSQIRRSSRSVCSSIGEAYRKRKYEVTSSVKQRMPTWKTAKRAFG